MSVNIMQGYRMEKDFGIDLGEDWFSYPVLYSNVAFDFPDGSTFVELGSWKGRSANYMGRMLHNAGKKNTKLYCIDTWEDAPHHNLTGDQLYAQFLNNTSMFSNIIAIRQRTASASLLFPDCSVDFVFVDAGHDYESVMTDLRLWAPKVRLGGLLAGHDYDSHPDVRKAVADFLGDHEKDLSDPRGECCFIMQKANKHE